MKASEEVTGPIARGKRLGEATVTVDGLPAGSAALRAGRSISAASGFDRFRSSFGEHPILSAAALFVILIGAALLWRAIRRRRRARGR